MSGRTARTFSIGARGRPFGLTSNDTRQFSANNAYVSGNGVGEGTVSGFSQVRGQPIISALWNADGYSSLLASSAKKAAALIPQSIEYALDADFGEFALYGEDSSFDFGLPADTGAFESTAQPAVLNLSIYLLANIGEFTLARQDATFRVSLNLPAANGEFNLTSQSATLTVGMTAGMKEFSFVGQPITVSLGLPASIRAFALDGKDAALFKTVAYVLDAGTHSFSFAGSDATLNISATAETGEFGFIGQQASLAGRYNLSGETGEFTSYGSGQAQKWDRIVSIISGSFSFAGSDAILAFAGGEEFELGGRDLSKYPPLLVEGDLSTPWNLHGRTA